MVTNNIKYDACPICFSEQISRVGIISYSQPVLFSTCEISLECDPELWTCLVCESSFVQNRVPEELAIDLYVRGTSGQRWSSESFVEQKTENQIKCLRQYFLNGKRVLDIGCNTGELLDFAKILGCETVGVEYSESSRKIVKGKGHLAISCLPECGQQFDVVVAFDLVEHLYDVPFFFAACKRLLKKAGALIILTGDIGSRSSRLCKSEWWYVRYPEHIVFPSRKYYSQHSGFNVHQWTNTFASRHYAYSWPVVLRGVVGGLLKKRFDGIPSLGPDHVLAVLKREQ